MDIHKKALLVATVLLENEAESLENGVPCVASGVLLTLKMKHGTKTQELLDAMYDLRDKLASITEETDTITAGECDQLFELAKGTTRQACNRGTIQGRRSAGTWLVSHREAEEKWGAK